MTRYLSGKYYLTISKQSPYYTTDNGKNRLWKKLFKIGKFYVAIRVKNINGLTKKGLIIAKEVFSVIDINRGIARGLTAMRPGNVISYYLTDIPFIFNGDKWDLTEHYGVFLNKTKNKYYGFTHRGGTMFGIGDMLFDEKGKEDTDSYYDNIAYRLEFIKTLQSYRNDAFMFRDLVKSGITDVIPFRKRGRKVIETMSEALEAAINMRNYLS